MARTIADVSPRYTSQPMVVINKTGGAGSIAAAEVIASKPDGSKFVVNSTNFFAITVKTQKIPFNPAHLVPIASFMEFRMGFIVRADSPWKTLNDLLSYARKNPGKLKWAHPGRGLSAHLRTMFMFKKAGIDTIDIPYKGSPEQLVALLGRHVDASTMVYGGGKEHVKAGKVRFLTVFNDRRYVDLPDVPTAADLGFPEVTKLMNLVGVYAHKDTPETVQKSLYEVFKKVYEHPGFKEKIEELGEEPRFEGREFTKDQIKINEEVAIPIIKELGLYVER